jgi:hypothetical protein
MVERRLMQLARRGGQTTAKTAAAATKSFGVRSHFPRKDRRKTTTKMNVVFTKSTVRSLSCVREYTGKVNNAQVYREGGEGLYARPALGLGPLYQARKVTGRCSGCL